MSHSLTSPRTVHPLPGDLVVWIFILAELTVFSIFFIAYAFVRLNHPDLFAQGFAHLNRTAGAINTLALITSSYFVVRAVIDIHQDNPKGCSRWLNRAILMGAIYVVVKLWEYYEAFSAGYGLSTNAFYMFYFLLTFFHFFHVLLGLLVLILISRNARRGRYQGEGVVVVESGACYWHMIDLLWIILFPLVYVLN
ncbi:cytochrome c oxidase subunit 3 [Aestuariirhabdus sp. Z084]|uniref:cytochrome c oxidase subunit 3 n=1 Tax=Aestuariirhabdus haliotis TaxID=2918751 RepID=UPI00201B3FAC|nr:cytochrome c oxidase subunit 3 [Aestuariirhabdus haliotis]MCL6416950.1 cytochrome c oxidase subunit 3 [Aestuariirhabdus haliotis]MCL6420947.1 cytochrome c oxidase subunit 3 [Aestuariirhabdus haliotis]